MKLGMKLGFKLGIRMNKINIILSQGWIQVDIHLYKIKHQVNQVIINQVRNKVYVQISGPNIN